MHKLAEKIAECMKAKVEGMGIDNIEGQDLVELGMWTDIIKDLVCYDKDKKIIEAMEEAEDSEESMKYIEMYEDYPEMRKGYRGQPRSESGRFISRGDGRRSNRGRRGYEMPMMMYDEEWDEMQRNRDMDRNMGKMYYGGTQGQSSGSSSGSSGGQYSSRTQRDEREGRSGGARRGYMESKEMNKDKGEKMKELENYMKELSSDVTEMIGDASPEEKNMLKQKMQVLLQKIQ
jgi:hypothetical protein